MQGFYEVMYTNVPENCNSLHTSEGLLWGFQCPMLGQFPGLPPRPSGHVPRIVWCRRVWLSGLDSQLSSLFTCVALCELSKLRKPKVPHVRISRIVLMVKGARPQKVMSAVPGKYIHEG